MLHSILQLTSQAKSFQSEGPGLKENDIEHQRNRLKTLKHK